jgi:hypothetical protein
MHVHIAKLSLRSTMHYMRFGKGGLSSESHTT